MTKLRDKLLSYVRSQEETIVPPPPPLPPVVADEEVLPVLADEETPPPIIKKEKASDDKPIGTLSGYEDRAPSNQNAVELLEGWSSCFPEEYDVTVGNIPLFNDGRIFWGLEQYGALEGKRVLELGPLEGAHTSIIDRLNPSELIAVEANKSAYLRCLIAKEIYRMKHARFLLGDFVKYLEEVEEPFDFIVASGVLYHMKDPLQLLELIGSKSNAALIWTHYFDKKAMPKGDPRRVPFSGAIKKVDFMDMEVNLHMRSYYNAWKANAFCGGTENDHCWIEKDQMLEIVKRLGFTDIRLWGDEPDHPNGPCSLFYIAK